MFGGSSTGPSMTSEVGVASEAPLTIGRRVQRRSLALARPAVGLIIVAASAIDFTSLRVASRGSVGGGRWAVWNSSLAQESQLP